MLQVRYYTSLAISRYIQGNLLYVTQPTICCGLYDAIIVHISSQHRGQASKCLKPAHLYPVVDALWMQPDSQKSWQSMTSLVAI